jgi:ribosomal protein L35
MPRLKTHRASAKRFKVTGGRNKRFMSRRATQDHFNARENGETVRAKRRDKVLEPNNQKRVRVLMPYALKRKYKGV